MNDIGTVARGLRSIALGASGLLLLASVAQAQDAKGPVGPVEITVGSSAGGTPDVLMRNAAKILNEEKIVENPLLIVNRTGGSWTVASNWVLNKKGDPNTLMTIAQPMITTPIVQGQKNTFEALTPLGVFVQGDLMLVVQPDAPFNSLGDLVNAAKEKPRGISFAGANTGATDHMATGLLEKAAGVKLNYIPYDGGGAAQAAFLGGNVTAIFVTLEEGKQLIDGKKAKPLAILDSQRRSEPEFSAIPTAREQGVDFVWGQFWGLAGPPGLDPALATWWKEKLARLVASQQWKDFVKKSYFRSTLVEGDAAQAFVADQHKLYVSVLRDLGLSKQ